MRTVPISALFKQIFKRWKYIVILSLLGGILLGVREIRRIRAAQAEASQGIEDAENSGEVELQQYYSEVEAYNRKKEDLNSTIQTLQERLTKRVDYAENSVLHQIDPYNEAYGRAELYVIAGEQEAILDENGEIATISPIMMAYYSYLNTDISYLENAASELGQSLTSIRECCTFGLDQVKAGIVAHVKYIDEASAQFLLNTIIERAESVKTDIETIYGEHELFVLNENVSVRYDSGLYDQQKTLEDELNSLRTSLENNKTLLESLAEPEIPVVLEQTSQSHALRNSAIKGGVKGLLVGAIAGILLIALFLLLRGNLLAETEIENIYGIKLIGEMSLPASEEELAAINYTMKKSLQNQENVALVGDVSVDKLHAVEELLQKNLDGSGIKVSAVGRVATNIEAIENVDRADKIILVSQIEKTNLKRIDADVSVLSSIGKTIWRNIVLR